MTQMRSPSSLRAKKRISATIQAKFQQGVALHQQGRLTETALIYQEVLQQEPAFFDATHLLGVVALQTGRIQQSIELITKAIELNPNVATAHSNLGAAFVAQERFAEALLSLDRAIGLKADIAEAHNNRAAALNSLKQHDQALASCDKAIALRSNFAEAYNNRAVALNALKRHEQALTSCDKALALKPNYPEALNNRGSALNALMHHDAAVASYDKAVALKRDYAEAYSNRGNALYQMARPEQSLASYDKAIELKPEYAEAHDNRGSVLSYLKRHEDALASYDKTIALKPGHISAYFNKSLLLLLMGRFEQGWSLYESRRKKDNPVAARNCPQPLWSGEENIAGKTILLREEQGLGDTIQFCRYAALVADLGARVILEVPKPLKTLLAGLPGVAQVVEPGTPPGDFDYQCSLLSLPFAFKTDLSNIPANIPYLKSNLEKSLSWKERLGDRNKLKVGLVWSGGFRQDQPETWSVNKRRNIPLQHFASLKHPNIEFYSLQKGEPGESELAELKRNNWEGPDIIDFTSELRDFSDTAALLDNLDLVISVDTSTAHLAGALGKPVWILNRFDSCWRWLLDRTDSPWYPTARLYRQGTIGDWESVVRCVKMDLSVFETSRAP